jgi:polysaccharide biosynthesis protein PslG
MGKTRGTAWVGPGRAAGPALAALALVGTLLIAAAGPGPAEAGQVGIAKRLTKEKIVADGARVIKNDCRSMGRGGKRGVKCNWFAARLIGDATTRNCKGYSLLPKRARELGTFTTERCTTDNGATAVNGTLPAKLLDQGFESTYVFCFTTLGNGYACVWQGLRHKPAVIEECDGTATSADHEVTIRVGACKPSSVASAAQAAVKALLSQQGLTPGLVACRPGGTISCSWEASRSSGGWKYSCSGTASALTVLGPFNLTRCNLSAPDLAPLGPAPGPHPEFGINDVWASLEPKIPALAHDFGATTARFVVNWNGIQETPSGDYDFRHHRALFDRMQDNGIDPVLVIQAAPCWATSDPDCTAADYTFPPDSSHVDEWGDFAAAVAEEFPEAMGIEVWNEANAGLFYDGGPRPAQYAGLLREAYTSIKAVEPGMPVITSGTAAYANNSPGEQRYDEFLRDVYEALGPGAGNYSDGIGHHGYPGGGPTADIETGLRGQIADLKDVMLDFGDQDKPIWITESGVSTTGREPYTEKQQADAYVKIYRQFRRIPGVPVVIMHRWRNGPGPGGSAEPGFGLTRADGSKKPVYCALAAARGHSLPPGTCG